MIYICQKKLTYKVAMPNKTCGHTNSDIATNNSSLFLKWPAARFVNEFN